MSKVSELEQNYQERILKTLVYIQHHLNEELSLEKLSAVANFSPFHFHRFFLAYTGEPLQSYIRRLRLVLRLALVNKLRLKINKMRQFNFIKTRDRITTGFLAISPSY